MTLKKDKQKVLGETFDDDRIKTFLQRESRDDVDRDFHLLETAYRGMKADNFATFVRFFSEAGHNINATNLQGQTFLSILSEHRQADDYILAMEANGATA